MFKDSPTTVTPVKLTVVPGANVTFAWKLTAVLIVTGTLMVRWLVNGKDGSMSMVVLPISVVLLSVVSETVNPTSVTPVRLTTVPGAKVTLALNVTGTLMVR